MKADIENKMIIAIIGLMIMSAIIMGIFGGCGTSKKIIKANKDGIAGEVRRSTEKYAKGGVEKYMFCVQPGDCLWNIAKNELGSPWLWPLIWYDNKNIVKNPNVIEIGWGIVLKKEYKERDKAEAIIIAQEYGE